MDGIPLISLADLLHLSLPLSGAASLLSTSPSPPPQKKPKLQPSDEHPSRTPLHSLIGNAKPSANSSSFAILKGPVILVGTIDILPYGLDECSGCGNDCFSFSDGSARICCSVLDFNVEIMGREIHVLAWNFVPFKTCGRGVLEVIRWRLPPSGLASDDEYILSMVPAYRSQKSYLAERSIGFGILNSVSPVFMVPCRNPSTDGEGSIGFLAEVATCTCGFCSSSVLASKHHSFTKLVFVYFLKPASRWRPLLAKMVGKVIRVSGLKKKLVFVGGEEKYVMLVTTEKTVVSFCQLTGNDMAVGIELSPRKSDRGVYSGAVTGVYMQGMVIELDEKVWVLTTDSVIPLQHSLRVGAIVSVMNFHLVRANFYSTRVLLLGTCVRSRTDVKSFSPSCSRCHLKCQNQSLLGKFIESLTFSARFWILLLVSCFRRKFAGMYSEKDILGSRKKEGLAQIYARSFLPQEVYHSQRGLFKEFCNHELYLSRNESTPLPLKLVLPLSNFISNCEAIWQSITSELRDGANIVLRNNSLNKFSCEGRSYCRLTRKFLASKDLGIVLMGTLKVCSSTGRLQLVDATGSVDVVVPDLHSNINVYNIIEVKDYKLVLEGMPRELGQLRSHLKDPLSCRNIFQQFKYKKELKQLVLYVQFYLSDSSFFALTSPLPSRMVSDLDVNRGNGGTYHLLRVCHKFPASKSVEGGIAGSTNSSMFAEAVLSPYDVIILEKQKCGQLTEVLHDNLQAPSGNFENRRNCTRRLSEQLNYIHASSAHMGNNSNDVIRGSAHIPCLVNFAGACLQGALRFGFLCHSNGRIVRNVVEELQAPTILLEFRSECFDKYQCLHLEGCYLLRCSKGGLLCDGKCCEYVRYGKALVSSRTPLWSTSFSFGHRAPLSRDHFSVDSVVTTDDIFVEKTCQNELLLQHSLDEKLATSDIHLQFSEEAFNSVNAEMENVNEMFIRFFGLLPEHEVLSVSKCINIMMAQFARPIVADIQRIKLPQGNLISINGNIEDIHVCGSNSTSYLNSDTVANQSKVNNICIHIYDECHMVRIRGTISKYAYPVGMGPGVNATFYRVLITQSSSRCCDLMLLPVSFIAIKTVKEVNPQCIRESLPMPSRLDIRNDTIFDMVSMRLVSHSAQLLEGKLVRFKCRVVAVHFLVLEKQTRNSGKLQSRGYFKQPVAKVPLAGFILDDGSSLCCCWTEGDRSNILLRLHDAAIRPFFGSHKISQRLGNKACCSTVGYYLEKLLKKHGRVTVSNHSATPDSYCLGFTFSVNSGKVFSRSEECLLKYIVLNASSGPLFNVVGSAIIPSAFEQLTSELKHMHVPTQQMENIWLREVGHIDPLKDARSLLHDLSKTP